MMLLTILHVILVMLYGYLAIEYSSKMYGFCCGCWVICLILDFVRIILI